MNDVIMTLNWINDIVFVSLVNTTIQMIFLTSLVIFFIWILRIKSSAIRYSLWLLALFAIAILPLLTPFMPQIYSIRSDHQITDNYKPDDVMKQGIGNSNVANLSEGNNSVSATYIKKTTSKENISIVNPVSVVYFIWCAGVFFMSYITIGVYKKLRRLRICSSDVEDQASLEMLSRLRNKLNIKRSVILKESSEIYSPISMGIISPVIIVPDNVMNGGSANQMEMILAHELAHIKRYDYLVCLFQNVLRAVFFFHPLFYVMSRSLAKEREHICDDWVIGMTGRRNGYAECIIGLLESAVYKVNIPAIIAMAERKRDIPGRIDMIVDRSRKLNTRLSRKVLVVMLLIGCIALPLIAGIELIRFAIAKPASNEGRIVFSKDGQGKTGVWVMDADGRKEKQLTYGIDRTPVWSPDGRQIAFYRYAEPPNLREIYVVDADGSDIKRLTEDSESDINPSWSPDGKQIVFERSIWDIKDNNWEFKSWAFCIMDSNGSNIRILIEEPAKQLGGGSRGGGSPVLSPDGKKIAYHYWAVDRPALHVMDTDGRNSKMLHFWGGDAGIDWSPDGKKIAFASCQDSWAWNSNDIYVINADGTGLKILTQPGPPWYLGVAWSPDGTKIAFSSDLDKPGGGNYDIYVMDADGSNVQRLTNTLEFEYWPDWTASSYAVEPAGKLKSTWGKIKAFYDKL